MSYAFLMLIETTTLQRILYGDDIRKRNRGNSMVTLAPGREFSQASTGASSTFVGVQFLQCDITSFSL